MEQTVSRVQIPPAPPSSPKLLVLQRTYPVLARFCAFPVFFGTAESPLRTGNTEFRGIFSVGIRSGTEWILMDSIVKVRIHLAPPRSLLSFLIPAHPGPDSRSSAGLQDVSVCQRAQIRRRQLGLRLPFSKSLTHNYLH